MREEQERFVDLLENAPVGFYSADAEGRFLFANHTLCEWLGLAQNDLGRVRLHDVVAGVPAGTAPYDPFGLPGASQGEVLLKDSAGDTFRASIRQDLVADEAGGLLRTRPVVRDLARRPEERRGGQEGVSPGRLRLSPYL